MCRNISAGLSMSDTSLKQNTF